LVPPVSGQPASARQAALEALHLADHASGFLREELHAVFDRLNLDPRDRGLATQLAAGVVRHRRTLRLVLSHLRGGHGRAGSIQPHFRDILELGIFQLLYLDRVPAYAAINEAVEQARRAAPGRAAQKSAGFVNGVLRGLQRLIVGREPDGTLGRDALPHPDGGIIRLKEPILPDPKEGLPQYLGAAYSFPDWLVAAWVEGHGDQAEAICRWSNRRPHIFARLNPGREREFAELSAPGEPAASAEPSAAAIIKPGPRSGSVDVSDLSQDRLEELIAAGVLAVQDPSAMAPVEALAPKPGESILDLCASPGTKTMQIAEALAGLGLVVACDRTTDKLTPIRKTAAVRGMTNVSVCLSDDADKAAPEGGFHAALVDAPCSNTGVLARRTEARWRLRPEDLIELPRVQLVLLDRAATLVRPGGRLVYSTCSIMAEENAQVVSAFLASHPGWRLVRSDLLLPTADHDGAFWALLAK
jgi:16S rRNA (cytosine967-C5)-methyltransferase